MTTTKPKKNTGPPAEGADDISRETFRLPANIAMQLQQRAEGRRKIIRHGGTLCAHCHECPPASGRDRYCHGCRATYNRDRRKAEREELKRLRAQVGAT